MDTMLQDKCFSPIISYKTSPFIQRCGGVDKSIEAVFIRLKV